MKRSTISYIDELGQKPDQNTKEPADLADVKIAEHFWAMIV